MIDASRRKLAAKRLNERVKLAVTTINALAIGIAGSAIILPAARDGVTTLPWQAWIWILVAFALHLVAQGLLSLLRSED